MGTTSSAIFTGASAYSQDFQNIISRATAIASLPITQLKADVTDLNSQTSALTGLDDKFKAVQTAVQGISDALSGSSFQADISDESKLNVSLSTGAVEGNYTVEVIDPGAYATSMTPSSWVAGSGAARNYQLSVGGKTYALSVGSNDAATVAAAINSQHGDVVHATVVNVGSSASADYRISLQATTLGDLKPDLLTGPTSPTSLQTQQTRGSSTIAASQTGQTWNDDPSLTFQLSLNGQTHSLSPLDTSAQGVVNAINTQYGSQVTASVTDLDPNGAHDYRISLVAKAAGNTQPDILASDGINSPVSLQHQTTAGSDTLAVSQTTADWTAATGAPLTYQLSLGRATYAVSPKDNNAASLVSAINTQYGDKVTASLNDTQIGTAHSYKITLTAKTPGDLAPDLVVSQVSLQGQKTTGVPASYIVNNSGKTVTSDSRTITIATGVNVTLLAKDNNAPVNITVIRPTSALSDALQSFTSAFNGAVDELDAQRGAAGGALAGQSLVSGLSRTLANLANYTASGGITNLPALGLELDKTGHLTFNSYTLVSADFANSSAVTNFLGSTTSGFLKTATDAMTAIEDATSGSLPQAEAGVQAQITSINNNMADIQARVDQMASDMQQQMSAADAAIASMQQQYSYLASMFQAMQTADLQYK